MPHMRIFEKTRIIPLVEDGWSFQQIGDRFVRAKSTVQIFVEKWRREQTVQRKRGTGISNKKTSNQEDINLVDYVRENPFETAVTAVQLQAELPSVELFSALI